MNEPTNKHMKRKLYENMFISSALGTNNHYENMVNQKQKKSINFGMIVLLDWLDDCMFEFCS